MPKILSESEIILNLKKRRQTLPFKAMYASWLDGIITDPALMLIPIDDHMVHRGDGVFEAIRFRGNDIFLLNPHLERLTRSAQSIALSVPADHEELSTIIRECIAVSGLAEGMIRIFVSRGSGDFSCNPFKPISAELAIIIVPFYPLEASLYEKGVSAVIVSEKVKPYPYPTIKSCNYLPNVMMIHAATKEKADYALGMTDEGWVTEGPTENILVIDKDDVPRVPSFNYTLKGTTLLHVTSFLEGVIFESNITKEEVYLAKEVMFVGTTIEILPVVRIDNNQIGEGVPGATARHLRKVGFNA
jgi:branched-chain amino acid aminotransferase